MHINEVLKVVINQAECLCLDDSTDREVLIEALDSALDDFFQGQYSSDKEYILESIRYLEWKAEQND